MSALVRFGFDAPDQALMEWVIDEPSPGFASVLRRCLPPEPLPAGWYRRLHQAIVQRPRSARMLCQVGEMCLARVEVALTMPSVLVERSVLALAGDNVRRAKAISELWQVAIDRGRDPHNLRRAICSAKDVEALEGLLTRAVQADLLPLAPHPTDPAIRCIKTAKELVSFGFELKNCMALARGPFGLRRPATSYFIWTDPKEGPVMLSVCADQVGWRITEARLARNKRPSDRLFGQIASAFGQVGVRVRPEVSDLLMAI